jgi:hypothetical protein
MRRQFVSWLAATNPRLAGGKGRGQILMIYGIGAMAIMGFAGLAIDGGSIFTQRRLAQNGADAAALVGARDIANGSYSSVDSHVTTYAQGNTGSTANVTWNWVDNAGASVSQANATGVSVAVTKTFSTYFIRALGMPTFTVSARGTALTQLMQGGGNAPFIVCADGLKVNESFFSGGLLDYSNLPPSIRPEAIWPTGPEFYVHGSKVGQDNGGCGWTNSSQFKGNADTADACSALPCWYEYSTGTSSGIVAPRVAGYVACTDSNLDQCVAVLPIAAHEGTAGDTCSGSTPSTHMCVVAWGAFFLRNGGQPGDPNGCHSNGDCHVGQLLGNVIITAGGGIDRTPGMSGPMVVRLLG